ncbi:hypothetical protein QJS10_CPB12g00861 [Acorus calamus]|uniref:Transposase-associated domain-containing protein n=1 Tax=Acorus calamus TaxID=4465 RepID=A0AAV9DL53_ACOCL|nr:hypothetical protein QJS10_CPB12g00861 [Acorus calamus]
MDKSWMFIRDRRSDEFRAGVASFLEVARNCPAERKNEAGHIRCPCQRCANRFYFSLETVEVHLYKSGIMSGYTTWISHGEVVPPIQFPRNTREHQFPRNIHEHNLPQPSGVDEEEDEEYEDREMEERRQSQSQSTVEGQPASFDELEITQEVLGHRSGDQMRDG